MKKFGKTVLATGLSVLMVIPLFSPPEEVEAASQANSIADLRRELNDYIAKKKKAENNKNLTQSQINANKNSISAKQTEIENSNRKIEEATEQIAKLDAEIEETDGKIKDLLRQTAKSNGDNIYLEYIFGAKDVSDFIIRYSVSEKVAAYNDELITSYENKIKENEQLKIDLSNRKVELNNQISSLETAIDSLGNQLSAFVEQVSDFDQDVKSTQALINYYVSQGCKENESFDVCLNKVTDTGFVRPLSKGVRTSNFGYRTHPVTGVKQSFHTGVDIGGNAEGTKVYSAARGTVAKIIYRYYCGGNQVFIHHTINGKRYTTQYQHLYSINVKVGQQVDRNTAIGTVGGGSTSSKYGGYDTCTTGAHLHFSLATGWYGTDYVAYSSWVSHLVDGGSKQYANIPAYGIYFYSRTW